MRTTYCIKNPSRYVQNHEDFILKNKNNKNHIGKPIQYKKVHSLMRSEYESLGVLIIISYNLKKKDLSHIKSL